MSDARRPVTDHRIVHTRDTVSLAEMCSPQAPEGYRISCVTRTVDGGV